MYPKFERDEFLPFVSIVIPTFNRKKLLEKCLNSLFKMDYPKSKFEVIVVDGGSTDGTALMIKRKFPMAKLVVEKRRGRSFARNTGWKYAKGQFVAYTDDDCVVDRFWLRSLMGGFNEKGVGGVGGPLLLLLYPESTCRKFDGTPVGDFHYGRKRIFVKELVTANLAVKYEVFDKNKFDVSLIYDLEDIDFCKSLIESGFKLLYVPDAKVYHNLDPKKVTVKYILKRAFFAGISLYIMERKRNDKILLTAKFLRKSIGGFVHFLLKRRLSDFFWFAKCSVAFLTSVLLIFN